MQLNYKGNKMLKFSYFENVLYRISLNAQKATKMGTVINQTHVNSMSTIWLTMTCVFQESKGQIFYHIYLLVETWGVLACLPKTVFFNKC